MRFLREQVPRPLRWGFFVLSGVVLIVAAIRLGYPSWLEARWDEANLVRQEELRYTIQSTFEHRVKRLVGVASSIAGDSSLLGQLTSNNVEELVRGYEQLRSYEAEGQVNIDLLDPKGTPIAWQGRKAFDDYQGFLGREIDTVVALTTSGLRTFLAVGVPAGTKGILVVVNEPFEVNLPISNRFVREVSFKGMLEDDLGINVQVLYAGKSPVNVDDRNLRVDLKGSGTESVATVIVPMPTIEGELERFDARLRVWMNGLLAILGVVLALLIMFRLRERSAGVIRATVFVALLWLVRFLWISLEFPAALIGGFLFDPGTYASPFAGGLAASLGDTLLSAMALFSSVLCVASMTGFPVKRAEEISPRPRNTILTIIGIGGGSGLLILLLRAYGAALRSFVFDSTLQFVEPSEVVPSIAVIVMYGNIILITAAFFVLVVFALGVMSDRLRSSFRNATAGRVWVLIFGIYLLMTMIFLWVNRVPQFPWYAPFLVFGGAAGLLLWPGSAKGVTRDIFSRLSSVSVLLVLSFLLSMSVLDVKIHEKEEDRVRLYAQQLTRPVDAWLSFVLTESFRSAVDEYHVLSDGELEAGVDLAFPLWAKTLMGKEGYNSTLVLYDKSGYEIDRFTVGLTSYEQSELLKRLFDVGEEGLNVVERRVQEGLIKYYGIWGTIRDEQNRLLAITALLLGASEHALFRGEAPEPLRPLGAAPLARHYQSMYLLEYQDGRLASSNDLNREMGSPLPGSVRTFFDKQQSGFFQREETIGGISFETLYARDESRPGRIVAVSLEEVGLRWHIFNLVKVGAVYLLVLALISLVFLAVRWKESNTSLLGFRGKLIVAFLLIAILPLIVFGYYNREFAEEREEVNVSRRLRSDLELIHQRITTSLFDEEDFSNGITDDFCEAVAAEFGVDFTVFRRMEVQSSSRSELYQSGILDSRLPGSVYARVVVAGQGYVQTKESIGDVAYAVGYKPIVFDDRMLGAVAVPALYRQSELEAEVAERNAFTLGVYSVLLLLTVIGGVALANQLSQPVRDLTQAARRVGEGNLDVQVRTESSGELQNLILTFNNMVAELRRSRDELRRAERELAWKEMAKQVAHEIKNPLTPMKLSVQHLRQAFKDRASDLEVIAARVTQTLTEQIDTLARIATEFSSFARMPERSYERVDIHQLLKEALQLFHEVKGIEIRTNFSDTHAFLVADKDELRRVFINIIRNALQAMEERGSISVETRVESERCEIRIRDTGIGIPRHLQETVFQPNFSTKSDGMGLGLALAKKAVVDLNGTITVESEEGKGTTIAIVLPLGGGGND